MLDIGNKEKARSSGRKGKFMREVKEDLRGPDKEDDHPIIMEMWRRLLYLAKESDELGLFK